MSQDSDEVTGTGRPALRIVRGNPDEAELAAVTAVLTGLAAARSAAAQQSEQPMSLWGAPETALRYPAGRRPLRPGPHAWRASSFPA
ncbi:acyl-CoA carboxylase subunit epsilon [Saccharopolyspora rectivirgula]|jgi:hypothetical protein|uniref:Acetyl-CoA carboxylase n=1 Tax=Saccharopolyspora rectivirgula TaxID=28042 RepID=A0A073B075_9PSEU|nr:acyl-CoA carboxylase subunit epsilon [Saccharopolyspora rectivirgula]KEI45025.1 acetyl-CoA carboxylase [Saccharopolyspora rectivirgula]